MLVKSNGIVLKGEKEEFKSLKLSNMEIAHRIESGHYGLSDEFVAKFKASDSQTRLYSCALIGAFWTPFGEICKDLSELLFNMFGINASSFGTIGETMEFIGLGGAFQGFVAGCMEGLIVFIIVLFIHALMTRLGTDVKSILRRDDCTQDSQGSES